MPSEGIAASDDEGSRHAAPRRPLLRRLHMPVGKAIALAAMPSAALMGMGFSSPLAARADQQPENPFQDAPCVEMPDEAPTEEAEETEEPAEEPEETEEPAEEETREPEQPEEEPAEEPEPEPTEDAAADQQAPAEEPAAEGEPAEEEAQAEAEAEAEAEEEQPAEEEGDNPWDPLGLGDSLEELGESIDDFFNPGRDEQPEEPVTPEDPEESEEPREPTQPEEPDAPEETEETEEPENVAPPAEADETEAPEAEEETEPAEEEEDAESEDEESEEAVEVETVDPFAPDAQGRLPFPCPEELRVPGTDEQTPLILPDQPWYLDASYLTLRGLDYHGVVNVTTANGTVKQVLKFTAELIDIGDLHQIVDAPGGVRYHVGTDPGSNSTFRDGTVTMYTERLEGNLFGIIPVVFDPEHQPPLDLPIAYFTDVFITQAGQFGGTLAMQGMRSYTTNDGPTVVG
ncbi:hypothetical protein [Streptomyces sp. NPDC127098]|uniref:hypothetical protein n=1 Tax=Streptomyces sp. NPDC127098 TaxID=3347137 RepID=UPI003666FA61